MAGYDSHCLFPHLPSSLLFFKADSLLKAYAHTYQKPLFTLDYQKNAHILGVTRPSNCLKIFR